MRWLRAGAVTAAAAAAALAALAGLLVWTLGTEAGSAWLIAQLQARSPVAVSISEVRGTLWHGLEADDVEIVVDGDRIQLDSLETRLRLADLLGGSLTILELSVSDVRYTAGGDGPAGDSAGAVSLPIAVRVLDFSVDRLVVTGDEADTVLGPLSFAVNGSGNEVAIERIIASALGFGVRGDVYLTLGG
ncbi:MAG: hypothetical protein HKN84_14430, partial [Gammaproteobacteria bacterium]|nr:hypothetical protein [Gammaproteobacteria bacterium]